MQQCAASKIPTTCRESETVFAPSVGVDVAVLGVDPGTMRETSS